MSTPLFIGDEISAYGFRLAGMQVLVPAEEDLVATLEQACEQAPLILLGADYAQQIPTHQLERFLAQVSPPVLIVPDVRRQASLPDLGNRVKQQLGVVE